MDDEGAHLAVFEGGVRLDLHAGAQNGALDVSTFRDSHPLHYHRVDDLRQRPRLIVNCYILIITN